MLGEPCVRVGQRALGPRAAFLRHEACEVGEDCAAADTEREREQVEQEGFSAEEGFSGPREVCGLAQLVHKLQLDPAR